MSHYSEYDKIAQGPYATKFKESAYVAEINIMLAEMTKLEMFIIKWCTVHNMDENSLAYFHDVCLKHGYHLPTNKPPF